MSPHVFFHLAQAHWRKIQNLGLMEFYITNEQYSLFLRSFTALAFVPQDRIAEYFKHLCDSVPEDAPTGVHDFIDYVADTYVGKEVYERAENQGEGLVLRLRRPRWKEPKFAPRLWSLYERVLNDEPITIS